MASALSTSLRDHGWPASAARAIRSRTIAWQQGIQAPAISVAAFRPLNEPRAAHSAHITAHHLARCSCSMRAISAVISSRSSAPRSALRGFSLRATMLRITIHHQPARRAHARRPRLQKAQAGAAESKSPELVGLPRSNPRRPPLRFFGGKSVRTACLDIWICTVLLKSAACRTRAHSYQSLVSVHGTVDHREVKILKELGRQCPSRPPANQHTCARERWS
ncbi:hypothetical protein BC828DRAFT_205795 [Blastocladiella britannica]|nr:hypothetical protein BC828DRAFT_205795 [Blastocladiella britannica]